MTIDPTKPRSTEPLPREANLCGILYSVSEHEGAIVFSEAIPVWGCKTRIMFTRDPHEIWYLDASGLHNGRVPACHVLSALEFCKQHRGDSFTT